MCNKTRKTFALRRENEFFLLFAKLHKVNTVATLSPPEADDHSDGHVQEADIARGKTLPRRPYAADTAEQELAHVVRWDVDKSSWPEVWQPIWDIRSIR